MRILLLSDATMCANAGGLAQTLYNIFSFVDPGDILCVAPDKALKANTPSEPFTQRYISYRFELIETPRNRFAKYIRPFADWFNYSYNNTWRSFKGIQQQIKDFNADVVVSCPNGPVGLFMHHKLLAGLDIQKVFPYFMDDWMYQSQARWLSKKIHTSGKEMLAVNHNWLMISSELSGILQERYHIQPKRVLEIHNPVDLSNAPAVQPVEKKAVHTLAYAGSLWPMHFDAYQLVARAAHSLNNKEKKINLVVYTSVDFWNWRKAVLEPLGVTYGGNIPYKDIHRKLSEADALILVSSFSKEWYTHSKGSVQTKITDYLKAQRLVISCGPDYSANHLFIKRYACGVCIETEDVTAIADRLDEVLGRLEEHRSEIANGWQLLESDFTFEKVHQKLQNFLSGPYE